jgi:hypothetical protein
MHFQGIHMMAMVKSEDGLLSIAVHKLSTASAASSDDETDPFQVHASPERPPLLPLCARNRRHNQHTHILSLQFMSDSVFATDQWHTHARARLYNGTLAAW